MKEPQAREVGEVFFYVPNPPYRVDQHAEAQADQLLTKDAGYRRDLIEGERRPVQISQAGRSLGIAVEEGRKAHEAA